jgi:hypothetical protein
MCGVAGPVDDDLLAAWARPRHLETTVVGSSERQFVGSERHIGKGHLAKGHRQDDDRDPRLRHG